MLKSARLHYKLLNTSLKTISVQPFYNCLHTFVFLNPYTKYPSQNLLDSSIARNYNLFHQFLIQPHSFFTDSPTPPQHSNLDCPPFHLHNESGFTATYYNPKKLIESTRRVDIHSSAVPAAGHFSDLESSHQEIPRAIDDTLNPVRHVAFWGMPDLPSARERVYATNSSRTIANSEFAFLFSESRALPPEIQLFPLDRRPPENSNAEYLLINPTSSFGFRGNSPISLHIRDFENELIQIWTIDSLVKSCFILEAIRTHFCSLVLNEDKVTFKKRFLGNLNIQAKSLELEADRLQCGQLNVQCSERGALRIHSLYVIGGGERRPPARHLTDPSLPSRRPPESDAGTSSNAKSMSQSASGVNLANGELVVQNAHVQRGALSVCVHHRGALTLHSLDLDDSRAELRLRVGRVSCFVARLARASELEIDVAEGDIELALAPDTRCALDLWAPEIALSDALRKQLSQMEEFEQPGGTQLLAHLVGTPALTESARLKSTSKVTADADDTISVLRVRTSEGSIRLSLSDWQSALLRSLHKSKNN